MLVQVRWGHGDPSGRISGFRRLLHAEFVGDDDHIAPNGKRIAPEMLRRFKIFPSDEIVPSPTTLVIEVMHSSQCQRLLRHFADETEIELRLQSFTGLATLSWR